MPLWGIAASVVVLLALGAFALSAASQQPQSTYASEPRPVPTFSYATDETPAAHKLAFIGDSYTHGIGATNNVGYAYRVAETLGYPFYVDGVDGSGYLTAGTGEPIPARVQGVIDSGADTVIVAGGFNDNGRKYDPATVGAAAQQTLEAIRVGLPEARIIMVGAFPVGIPVPAGQPPIEESLRSAAAAVGVEYVSPIDEGWVVDWASYIGPDGIHPSDAGHQLIADRLLAYLG